MTPSVCIVKVDSPLEDRVIRFLSPLAPPEKRERILHQRIRQKADNMLVGAALAKYMVLKFFHIPFSEQRLAYGVYGKPYLRDYPAAHFNLSHSGQFVACAVLDAPIGIDIQEIAPFSPFAAQGICTAQELLDIQTAADSDAAFTALWTKKEAYLKLVGCGFSDGMRRILPAHRIQLDMICQGSMVGCISYFA